MAEPEVLIFQLFKNADGPGFVCVLLLQTVSEGPMDVSGLCAPEDLAQAVAHFKDFADEAGLEFEVHDFTLAAEVSLADNDNQ
jgi:hypothetical protein